MPVVLLPPKPPGPPAPMPPDDNELLPTLPLPLLVLAPEVLVPREQSFGVPILRKVGVPSIVLTIGFNRPPRSNSCADIFL